MRVAQRWPLLSKSVGRRLGGKRRRQLRLLWSYPQQCNPLSPTRTKAPRPSTSEPLCFLWRTHSFPLDGRCRNGQSHSDLKNTSCLAPGLIAQPCGVATLWFLPWSISIDTARLWRFRMNSRKLIYFGLALAGAFSVARAAFSEVPLESVPKVDLSRYTGR